MKIGLLVPERKPTAIDWCIMAAIAALLFVVWYNFNVQEKEIKRKQSDIEWMVKYFPKEIPTCFVVETCYIVVVAGQAYLHPSGDKINMQLSDIDPMVVRIIKTPEGLVFDI